MHQCHNPIRDRFNKPSKELLVDYINVKNNRGLKPQHLVFGIPVLKDESGLSEVDVSFATDLGWPTDKKPLGYYRVDLEAELRGAAIVVHVTEHTEAAVLLAVREQYGLYLEAEYIELELVTRSLADSTPNQALGGFDSEDEEEQEPVEIIPPYLDNRNYRLTFKPNHLIFFGGLNIITRRSIELLGKTIDSLIDLREFYRDGTFDLPKVDLLIKNGELYVDLKSYEAYTDRRAVSSTLYEIPVGEINDITSKLPAILRRLTGDPWTIEDVDHQDFNLHGSMVTYNAFTSKDYTLEDSAFNYVLVIDLGKRCANLTGLLKIGYQFSSSRIPENMQRNFASVLPIFPR